MARLLVRTNPPFRGDITAVYPDGTELGFEEDVVSHDRKYGDRVRWSGKFVIVDIIGMSLTEAQRLRQYVEEADGKHEGSTTVLFNSCGKILYWNMADTPERQTELENNFRVSRIGSELGTNEVEERTA